MTIPEQVPYRIIPLDAFISPSRILAITAGVARHCEAEFAVVKTAQQSLPV
jgi:hypothetical protein